MTRNRSITFLATAGGDPLTALVLASCGGGSNDATASTAQPKTASGPPATVGLANSDLGKILVDSQGRTLYLFKKDAGTKSTCFGECASDWPPLRADGKPAVGSGASASMVGTTTRSYGSHRSPIRANARQHRRAQPLYGTATRESRRIMVEAPRKRRTAAERSSRVRTIVRRAV